MTDTVLYLWIPSILLSTIIGARKGELVGGFIVGCIFGPLGVLVALGSSGHNRPQNTKEKGNSQSLVRDSQNKLKAEEDIQFLVTDEPTLSNGEPLATNKEYPASNRKISIGDFIMYLFSVVFRLLWSLTIGLVFFLVGLILFLILDILMPNSDRGYRVLNNTYKWGSCYWFKGLKMVTDDFDVDVSKKRKDKEI
jgi:hypothetical protein